MAELANLQVVVGADVSQAEAGLNSLSSKVSSTGSAITAALGGALIGATAAVGAAFVTSVKSAADFEKQMSAVGAVAGASASEMEGLTKTALQLGKDTSFSATEAAQGIEELVKAGVSVADAMGGGARAALDLAAAGAVSVADAAELASNAMNVFNIAGSDMGHVADVIAGAANASAIGVNDYKFSLAAAGAVANTVGISFESLSQAIAVMGNAGIKGSDAGTSLKTMMMNLIPTTNKQMDLFRELGILTQDLERGLEGAAKMGIVPATRDIAGLNAAILASMGVTNLNVPLTKAQSAEYEKLSAQIGLTKNEFFDITGKAKSFGEISEVLKNALKGMTKEQQLATLEIMFGSDAIRAGAVLMEAGAEGFEHMAEAMGKVTAQQVAEERLNNLWGSLEKLKGSLETAAIMLGGMFTPALKRMADVANVYVGQAIEIIEQLPDAWRTVGEAFAGAWEPSAALTPFMNMVGMVGIGARQMYDAVKPVLDQVGIMLEIAGRGFDGFVIIVQQALAGDIPGAFANFLTLIGMQTTAMAELLVGWGQAFVDWIAPMIPPVMAALGQFAAGLYAWLSAQIPLLLAQLALWGAEFVAWVQPQIPPLLAALGLLGAAVLTWLAAQIPPIIAQLLLWGAEFIAWVAPQIPPLLAALGTLYIALYQWVIDQVPAITAALVKWGLLFGAWILGVAIPELIKALPGIITTLAEWAGTASVEITKLMLNLGVAIATGIVDGFLQAWPIIKGKITEAIGSIQLPSWMGGGGGAGLTSLSNRTGGSSGNALWDQIAREEGVDPGLLASLIQQESGGNQNARSGAGAIGLTQLMPGTAAGLGVDPNDPAQNVRGGARYLRQMLDKFGDEERALIAYNAGPDGGMPGESKAYAQRVLQGRVSVPNAGLGDIKISQSQWGATAGMTPEEAAAACGPYAAYIFAQATGRMPNPAEAEQLARASGWTTAGMGGTANFMRMLGSLGVRAVQQNTSGMSADAITQMAANAGPLTAFSTPGHYFASTGFDPATGKFNVGATGTFAGGETWMTVAQMAALMGPIQDIIVLGGQMGTTFTTAGRQVTDGLAPILPTTQTMADGVLTSVTDLGGALMVTTQDAAGVVTTTITDMAGNVTAQYTSMGAAIVATTVETGVQQQAVTAATNAAVLADIGTTGTLMVSMTQMTTGEVLRSYTDNGMLLVQTVTDTNGQIVSQTSEMGVQVVSATLNALGGQTTIFQDESGKQVTIVQNAAGQVVSSFGDISAGAQSTTEPIKGVATSLDSIEAPDAGPTVAAFNEMADAARNAAKRAKEWLSYLDDINNFDWDEGSGSKKPREFTPSSNTRASGGPVDFGETYLVGEEGPEMFTPNRNGTIIPNHQLGLDGGGGGGGAIDERRLATLIAEALAPSLAASRPIINYGSAEELTQATIRALRDEERTYQSLRGL